jgi:SAM-dependent methyltransferase
MKKLYVQYGCGLSAPNEWMNFDVSFTLRLQKAPIIGTILKSKLNAIFPDNVLYGDIVKGLPISDNSCDGLYCSHTLEHLSLNDFRQALVNSYKVLKRGGIFRCVVPDMENLARSYIQSLDNGDSQACINFVDYTLLAIKERPRGLTGILNAYFGNFQHLWMWDNLSLSAELKNVGFTEIRKCEFNDCEDYMFKYVEDFVRFQNAVAIECRK